MVISNSYSTKQWEGGATAKPVAATELDQHQREKGEPTGFSNLIVCAKRESSSSKIAHACTNGIAVSHIGDDGIEGFDPAFAVLAVPEKEKTENLSIDRLIEDRFQYYLQCQYQSQGKRAGKSSRWFPIESIGLVHLIPSRNSTRTPRRRDGFCEFHDDFLVRPPRWFHRISPSAACVNIGGAL